MPYTIDEALDNAGDLLKELAKKVTVESDGGPKITLSEVMEVLTSVGIKVINDLSD
jgi:hypothetical protein